VDALYLIGGAALLLGVVLPVLLQRVALSTPVVMVGVGAAIGLLPLPGGVLISPVEHPVLTEHVTEFVVIVALMGVGLAIDRPLRWRSWSSWKSWHSTWRLLGIGMPLTIAGVALLGWSVMGLAPAAALLLGAVLAPTDPVLAADVQVAGPSERTEEDVEQVPEDDEVRFALTSEAGLNDGMAFPFVSAAMLLSVGGVQGWAVHWAAWDLVGKAVLGVVVGGGTGWVLAKVAFRAPRSLRLADTGEPLLAIAATVMSYGLAEVAGGYGFVGVFACAVALRSSERGHHYHRLMHEVIERLERLLTLVFLLLLGIALTDGLLANLTWQAAVVGALLVVAVRPVAAWISLGRGAVDDVLGDGRLGPHERLVTAFFGVRGVSTIYYLAYATAHADVGPERLLWSTAVFTIVLSVVLHGVTATPAMTWLERLRRPVSTAGSA
jgi:sodium/hydrogen antiporter